MSPPNSSFVRRHRFLLLLLCTACFLVLATWAGLNAARRLAPAAPLALPVTRPDSEATIRKLLLLSPGEEVERIVGNRSVTVKTTNQMEGYGATVRFERRAEGTWRMTGTDFRTKNSSDVLHVGGGPLSRDDIRSIIQAVRTEQYGRVHWINVADGSVVTVHAKISPGPFFDLRATRTDHGWAVDKVLATGYN